MTDLPNDRIAALAARRVGARPARDDAPSAAPTSPGRPKRRAHAATGGRILATGLSVSAALVMAGAMASAHHVDPVSIDTVAATTPAPTNPPVVVRVVMVPATAPVAPAPVPSSPQPDPAPAPVVRAAPVKAKAVATSRGS